MQLSNEELAERIDHTLLRQQAVEADIVRLCKEARDFGFKAVCVHPCFVELCVRELKDCKVRVATVVGFPLGANSREVKAFEAEQAFANGASEVDMVINIGALKERKIEKVFDEIRGVVEVSSRFPGTLVKAIIETSLLTEEEKVLAAETIVRAGADYVKTSTGFGSAGATVEDVAMLAKVLGGRAKIKASGGIRTREQAEKLVAAGADRLGTSSGIAILTGQYWQR